MHLTTRRLTRPVRHARDEVVEYVTERPRRSIAGIVILGLLIGLGIWAWPELHRTVHIHRM